MSNENFNKWVENIKIGDLVAIRRYGWVDHNYELTKVRKVTKAQIHVGSDHQTVLSKFWKDGGRGVGDSAWHSTYIVEPTPELLESIKVANLRRGLLNRLHKLNWNDLSTEQLQQVFVVVQSHLKIEQ